jgi:hypothetical protein
MEYVYTMDINRYHIQSPTQIVTTQLGISQEYKQQCIKEIYRLGNSNTHLTNVKAIRSSYRIWEETKELNLLLGHIKESITNIIPIKDKRLEYNLNEAWSAIYKKNHYTTPHDHLPYVISFVYYLQSSGNTPLVFDQCNFQINPIDDMLLIFPSYLGHSVPKHNEETDRICIAGNIQQISKPSNQ